MAADSWAAETDTMTEQEMTMIAKLHTTLIAKKNSADENDKGFTLIELLVVVLIIGILAAIAIPVFLAQQDQAKASSVESDLASAKVAYVSFLVDNPGDTPTIANLITQGYVASDKVDVAVTTGGTAFCLDGTHEDLDGKAWSVSAAGGVTDTACAAAPAAG